MHYPTFKYAIRRIRVAKNSPIIPILEESGVPHEDDVYTENTLVFEFPIDQGSTRTAREVSAWEQFSLLAMLQREWADNMVSCTIYFDREKEGDHIEDMLAEFLPVVKSVSMLPHTEEGAYAQMPFEGITKEEYDRRVAQITKCDWTPLCGSDGMEERYCTNETCMLSLPATHAADEEKKEEVA
jgi:ribonucleoside-triphosphate reductase (thioredoxin)